MSQDKGKGRNYGSVNLKSDDFRVIHTQSALTAVGSKNIKCALDEITCVSLNLPVNVLAESKTWHFSPDPWSLAATNGQVLITFANIFFTIVRAPETTGGYRCYMTFRFDLTAVWGRTAYQDNPGVPISLEIKNATGGQLQTWDLGKTDTYCGMKNVPISFMRDFNPDIYDLIACVNVIVSGANFRQC